MEKTLPIYYSEYGRYITRFRSIPFYIDCLIPVQRRLLLVLYEIAREKFTKSAKVVGTVIGSYHPHGDQSAYGTLVNLVYDGYVDKQGNWGSEGLTDAKEAHYRYTECKLSKWVKDIAFEYIDFVPWDEYEFVKEPLYLPSPLPLGLIGSGIYSGIAFHRPLVPKYKIEDLSKRLVGLLQNDSDVDVIIPNFKNCTVLDETESQDQFNSILKNGIGRILAIPNGNITNNKIIITGRAPNTNFDKLIDDSNDEKKDRKLPINIIDLSKNGIKIEITPAMRKIDINKLGQYIWTEYLMKRYNINIITCNEKGAVVECGVDDILKLNYQCWQYAVFQKNVNDGHKLFKKQFDMSIIAAIRLIIQKYNSNTVDDIKIKFKQDYPNLVLNSEKYNFENNNWDSYQIKVNDDHIDEICSKKSIRSLINVQIDLQQIQQDINNQKQVIINTPNDCLQRLKSYM